MRATCYRRVLTLAILAWVLALVPGAPVFAVQPDELLSDPALETRARQLSAGLRCLVCQNQSIDDSDAPLARDLRLLVRERLTAGDSDEAVRDFIVARYGEFVLLRPPFAWNTFILWFAPIMLLVGGAFLIARRMAKLDADTSGVLPAALTAAEEAKLKAVLGESGEKSDKT